MDPQLLMPSPVADFNFDSTSTSPYTTAPSSPKILFSKFFYTTSTSTNDHDGSPIKPNAAADNFESTGEFESNKVVHELKNEDTEEDDMDFAFEFSGQLDRPSISDADELFDGGKIKPLEPQPTPRSYGKICLEAPKPQTQNPSSRGRDRIGTTTRHKVSRSLSPLGVSDVRSDDPKVSTTQSSPFGFTWYNKWNLKNLLLFRSTSEGSATTSDDSFKKYAMITKGDQDTKNSSFRSCDGGGSIGGSSRRRMKRKMSAHEMHYTANRAVAEEMRRKTFLPYKSGLLGCLGFTQDLREVSRRI